MNQYKQTWAAHAGSLDTPTLRNLESEFLDKTSPLRVATHMLALPTAAALDKLAAGVLTTTLGPTVFAVAASATAIVLLTYFTWSFIDYYTPVFELFLKELVLS